MKLTIELNEGFPVGLVLRDLRCDGYRTLADAIDAAVEAQRPIGVGDTVTTDPLSGECEVVATVYDTDGDLYLFVLDSNGYPDGSYAASCTLVKRAEED